MGLKNVAYSRESARFAAAFGRQQQKEQRQGGGDEGTMGRLRFLGGIPSRQRTAQELLFPPTLALSLSLSHSLLPHGVVVVRIASAIVMPAALNGAFPSLQARHEKQRLLFIAVLLVKPHCWHSHEAARTKGRSQRSRHSTENHQKSRRDPIELRAESALAVHGGRFGKRGQYQLPIVEPTCAAFGTTKKQPRALGRNSLHTDTLTPRHRQMTV